MYLDLLHGLLSAALTSFLPVLAQECHMGPDHARVAWRPPWTGTRVAGLGRRAALGGRGRKASLIRGGSGEEEAELELDEEREDPTAGASATGVRDNSLEPPARLAGPQELLATPATNPASKDCPLDAASPSANACSLSGASQASFATHF